MAPLQLSATELEALITGVSPWVAVLTGKGMAVRPAPCSPLSGPARQGGSGTSRPVVRVPDYSTAQPAYARWDRLHDAITAGHWLHIGYRDASASEGRNASSFPSGSSTGADAGRSNWCALRRAYRDFRVDRIDTLAPCRQGEGAPLARPWPITLPCAVGCVSWSAVAPKKSFRTDTRLSVALRYAGFSRPSTTEKTR